MSKRSAPQRQVLTIVKSGSYGAVTWRHYLACGHVEVRKRKAPSPMIACAACAGSPQTVLPPERVAQFRRSDSEARRMQDVVARRFGVLPSQVWVTMSGDVVHYVQVVLYEGDLNGLDSEEAAHAAEASAGQTPPQTLVSPHPTSGQEVER